MFIPAMCALIACSNSPKKDATNIIQTKKGDSSKKIAVADTLPAKLKKEDMREKLVGIWADSVGGNAVFQIDKKTFFYVDNEGRYNYKFMGDSIRVHYDGYYQSFAWKFNGDDVLVLTGRDGVTPFYRIKE